MANPWLAHVKATMKKHKGMKFKAILKMAKKTYKKAPGASPKKTRRKRKRRRSKGRKSKGRKKKTKRKRRRRRKR